MKRQAEENTHSLEPPSSMRRSDADTAEAAARDVSPVGEAAQAAVAPPPPPPEPEVKLVVFDFDQTLSVIHAFSKLADRGGTEMGQMYRVLELEEAPEFERAGGFSVSAFGGRARVEELRAFLQSLTDAGVTCAVCTRGLVGAVRLLLKNLSMLEFFSGIYGHIGDVPYGSDATAAYDAAAAEKLPEDVRQLCGEEANACRESKGQCVAKLMAGLNIFSSEKALLVDDDGEELKSATLTCRTFHVYERKGLTSEQLASIKRIVGIALAQ